jgi:hypothetical protein
MTGTAAVARHTVVNELLALFDRPSYLEVGVCTGATFDAVEAPVKVAVDPNFRFDHEAPERQGQGSTYHQVTSDEFFGSVVAAEETFDVIFLDGLHTLEQTLRDFLNALEHLAPDGVIVIDDVRPSSYLASLPQRGRVRKARRELGDPDKAWSGDVYRLVYFIDTFCQQLTLRTIADNHGQSVVWRARRPATRQRTLVETGSLTFEAMVLDGAAFATAPFAEILEDVRTSVDRRQRAS